MKYVLFNLVRPYGPEKLEVVFGQLLGADEHSVSLILAHDYVGFTISWKKGERKRIHRAHIKGTPQYYDSMDALLKNDGPFCSLPNGATTECYEYPSKCRHDFCPYKQFL